MMGYVRVAHVVWQMDYGGIETLVRELCRWQAHTGIQPVIVETGTRTGKMQSELKNLGFDLYRCPLNPKKSFMFRLAALLRTIKPVAIHYHCFGTAFLVAFAGRMAGVACTVETAHSINAYSTRTWQERRRVWVASLFSGSVTHRVAVSNAVKSCMPFSGGVRIIYNGVDCTRFEKSSQNQRRLDFGLSMPPEGVVVGHVASFRESKNHEALVRVAAAVKARSNRPIRFACAGDGERISKIRSEIQCMGLDRDVLLLGTCKNVPAFLACCDLFFMPSIYEGLPVACIEAMAAGVPPIVADVAGLNEVVSDDSVGRKFPLEREDAAVEAILELSENAELRRSLGAAARKRARESFSIEACAAQYNTLYGIARYQ